MTRMLRLATRSSKLALTQARAVAQALGTLEPGLQIEELHVVTSGDRFQDQPLQDLGGKGLFVKEIEQALLDGRADFAVHSMKDVPAELASGLTLGCIPTREDARDVLVSRTGATLHALPAGARVGTSSLRRRTGVLAVRPDLEVVPLRGNVDTRLRKVREGVVDATVLALAGLRRMALDAEVTEILDPALLVPAVGQGALGIEARADDAEIAALLARFEHRATRIAVSAERAFLTAVEGNCRLPVAAYAVGDGGELWLRAMLAEPDGARVRRGERRIAWPEAPEPAERVGREIGLALRQG
jgi:hydroxymethylbilane synthase